MRELNFFMLFHYSGSLGFIQNSPLVTYFLLIASLPFFIHSDIWILDSVLAVEQKRSQIFYDLWIVIQLGGRAGEPEGGGGREKYCYY